MNHSIIWRLIVKDLYLYRWLVAGALIAGIGGLSFSGAEDVTGNIGLILLLTSIVALGVFITIYGIMTERKEKSLLFVLSLPVSTMQYTFAKVASSLIAFLIPWLVLTSLIVGLTLAFDPPVDGKLPSVVAMMLFFLANFCVLIAAGLISGSETGAVIGIVFTNVAVSVYMTAVMNLPGIVQFSESPVAVWNPTILTILAIEAAVIAVSLGLTFHFQSRKKDFA